MALRVSVGNVNKKVIGVWVSVGGAWKKVTNAWSSEGGIYRLWWLITKIITGTSLSAIGSGSGGYAFGETTVQLQTNGTVTRIATSSPQAGNPGSPVPNWNTYGGTHYSWTLVSWVGQALTRPNGSVSEGTRVPISTLMSVTARAEYIPGEGPPQSGNGSIRFDIYQNATGPTPIASQSFGMQVGAS